MELTLKNLIDEDGIGASLRKTHRLYMRLLQKQLSEVGVSIAQYLHLRVLWEEGGLTQVDISMRLGIEKASSTSTIDALEKQGLIERFRDADDRRRVRVFLSTKGKKLCATSLRRAKAVADVASKGVPEAELKVINRWIVRTISNLEAALGEESTTAERTARDFTPSR